MSDITPERLYMRLIELEASQARADARAAEEVRVLREELLADRKLIGEMRSELERHNRAAERRAAEREERAMGRRARNALYVAVATAAVGGVPAIIEALGAIVGAR